MIWWKVIAAAALVSATSCDEATTAGAASEQRPSFSLLADPGRGFYRHTERRTSAQPALDAARLKSWREQGTTLVMRVFYLGEFLDSPLSDAYLEALAADLAAMEESGVKGIVRFAYSSEMKNAASRQAGEARVLEHLGQLAPVLLDHAPVIHCLQAGFLGAWGEWHSPHPEFLAADGSLDPETSRRFMQALLKAVPEPVFIQVRTPWQKMMLFDSGHPGAARVGHHNDCFLASEDDCGTYRNAAAEMVWLEEETRALPMGGETCAVNQPRSSGPSALGELERLHYNYLNSDYHPSVLNGWRGDGCYAEIAARLGHRIRCSQVKVVDGVVQVGLVNEGFAAPLYERPMQYRWGAGTAANVTGFSIRSLMPGGEQVVKLPLGEGGLELRWPDASPRLADRGDYALQLANPDIARNNEGWHQIEIGMDSTSQ